MPDLPGTSWALRCIFGMVLVFAGSAHAGTSESSAFDQAQRLLLSSGVAEATRFSELLQTAADQHDPLAEYDLGYCYEYGIGVAVDEERALALYQRAAVNADGDKLRAIAAASAKNILDRFDRSRAATPDGPVAPEIIAALLTYGTAMLQNGNVSAARLLFERAAGTGSAAAAIAVGKTHDPRFLAQIGAMGITPNPVMAEIWYRRAAALGDAEGDRLQAGLDEIAAQQPALDSKM